MTKPTQEWLEKWRKKLLQVVRIGCLDDCLPDKICNDHLTAIHAEVYAKAIEDLRDKAFENRLMDTIKHAAWFREEMKREKAKARRETLEEAVGACKQVSRERRAWDLHGVEAALECEERIANLADQLKEADGES